MDAHEIVIPAELRPRDGRFGSGPSKVPAQAIAALADNARNLLGTSHRQAPVRARVQALRRGLTELFALPTGTRSCWGSAARRSSGTPPSSH